MRKGLSTYLDLVRCSAALVAFLDHYSSQYISGGLFWQFQRFGHSAVIVFFVLSGFVIAYAAQEKETDCRRYLIARFARLLSVTVPAIVLTVLCDQLGNLADPRLYSDDPDYAGDHPLLRILTTATFTSQIWFCQIRLFSNLPYWSLPYEFWYYMIFAGLFYLTGRLRIFWCLAMSLLAGPKILILWPIWLSGVAAWRWYEIVPRTLAPSLFLASLAAIGGLEICGGVHLFSYWVGPVWPEKFSLYDYVLGFLVAVNLVAAAAMRSSPIIARWSRPIAAAAGFTFSLYLFHMPLMQLLRALAPGPETGFASRLIVGFGTLLCVVVLGRWTEQRKHVVRKWLLQWLGWLAVMRERLGTKDATAIGHGAAIGQGAPERSLAPAQRMSKTADTDSRPSGVDRI